jgi:cytochrome o ubiquinol oxidase subunit 2
MVHAVELMLIVIIPVLILLFFFAWRYRDRTGDAAANKKNSNVAYTPDWEHSKMDELVWWAIPFEIVLILGALTWSSTHALDPRNPLSTTTPPLVVDVVALDWKWLFIYPAQGIATVNVVRMPVGKPVQFEITSDAPMNSLWIPQLGGQLYAMTGMVNTLNLVANEAGTYAGGSANYSGPGFAQMQFSAEAIPQDEFDSWVRATKTRPTLLDEKTYDELAQPGVIEKPLLYANVEENLYNTIVMKFMSASGMHM